MAGVGREEAGVAVLCLPLLKRMIIVIVIGEVQRLVEHRNVTGGRCCGWVLSS